ncbi:MAG: hypothetical protein HYZ37_04095 [Candidatus Solibacter usitatus]|nr:hypothetical protein [Candidatus Solibacter usitatus]
MKTTVEIPDPIFRRAKQYCTRHGIPFRQLIEVGLRRAMDSQQAQPRFRLKPYGFRGKGQRIQDWSTIRELIYEGRGGVPVNNQ